MGRFEWGHAHVGAFQGRQLLALSCSSGCNLWNIKWVTTEILDFEVEINSANIMIDAGLDIVNASSIIRQNLLRDS